MPDSCPQVLAAADVIALADCDNDGVAIFLEELLARSPHSSG